MLISLLSTIIMWKLLYRSFTVKWFQLNFFGGHVLLRGQLQKYAKIRYWKKLRSALSMKSLSIPLNFMPAKLAQEWNKCCTVRPLNMEVVVIKMQFSLIQWCSQGFSGWEKMKKIWGNHGKFQEMYLSCVLVHLRIRAWLQTCAIQAVLEGCTSQSMVGQ